MKKKNISKKDKDGRIRVYKYVGTVFCMLVFIFTMLNNYHSNNTFIIDGHEYDIIRKAKNNFDVDPLVEKDVKEVSHILLAPMLNYMQYEKAIFLLSLLLLCSTIFFIYLTLRNNYVFLFIIGLSPFFLKSFISFSDFTILAFLSSAFVYFITNKKYIIALIFHILISLVNLYLGMFIIALILFLYLTKRINLLKGILFFLPLLLLSAIPKGNNFFFQKNILERLFIELGAFNGTTIIAFIMASIAIYMFWDRNKIINYSLLIGIIIAIFNLKTSLFIINIILVYLSSVLLIYLIEEKWEIDLLKKISIFLIFCSILFSGLSYISATINKTNNNPLLIESLEWLESNTLGDSFVFTHYSYGLKTKFFAERTVLLDDDLNKIKQAQKKYDDSEAVFISRNLEATKNMLKSHKIDYILITEEMKKGLVWNKEDEGLLFVIANSNDFKLVFNNSYVEIYEVSYISGTE